MMNSIIKILSIFTWHFRIKKILMFSFFALFLFIFFFLLQKWTFWFIIVYPYIYWNNVILLIEFNINILFNALIDRENKQMLNNLMANFKLKLVWLNEWVSTKHKQVLILYYLYINLLNMYRNILYILDIFISLCNIII